MSLRLACWVAGLSILTASCGGDEGDASDPGGSTGSGGDPGESTGGTGSNTGGTGSDTGGSESGTGGTVTPGNVIIPTSVPATVCESDQYTYSGTVGGTPVDESLILAGPKGGYTSLHGHSGGFIEAYVTDYDPNGPDAVTGALRFPAESAHAGKIWCVDEGSLHTDEAYSFVGHMLGQCPGTPVDGELYACSASGLLDCDGSTPQLTEGVAGIFNGMDAGAGDWSAIRASGSVWVTQAADYDVLIVADEPVTSNGSSSNATGMIFGVPGGSDPGAVYCIGGGTWERNENGAHLATLTNISLVGNCNDSPANENLEGCHDL